MNLYECNALAQNPCNLEDLVIPSIGYFRYFTFVGETSQYCFFNNSVTKLYW